ncbi:MAG: GNAT family N-acetyltransferase [Deltaproteobacteria bacterium]|nr:GNAT family N-acetyltransferase [Deltaproteobacteria bacterium]
MITIRPATEGDLDDIVRVERAANSLYAPYGFAAHIDALSTPRDAVIEGIACGLAWVAQDAEAEGSALVGFVLAHACDRDLHLDEIDVVPSRLRRGLGTRLLDVVLEEAGQRGAERLTLLTVDFVPWTLGFYAHHGFRVLSARELDARLLDALALDPKSVAPTQRSFEGRLVLARNLQAPAGSRR